MKHLDFSCPFPFDEEMLEHLSNCEACASRFAGSMPPPAGFAEAVLSKVKAAKKAKKQFYFYTARVAVAACLALALLFTVRIPDSNLIGRKITNVSSELQTVSEKIINWRFWNNEK